MCTIRRMAYFFLLCMCVVVGAAQTPTVSGKWDVIFKGTTRATLTLQQSGANVTGTLGTSDGTPSQVNGTFDGTTLTLSRDTGLQTIQRYRVTVQGSSFTGTYWNDGKIPDRGEFAGTKSITSPPAKSAVTLISALPNLAGRWSGVNAIGNSEGDGTETIEQSPSDPNRLLFRNFGGDVSWGHFLNATTVIADDWQGGLRGTLEDNGRTIRWANSTSWSRPAPVVSALPSLAGRWTGVNASGNSEGDGTETIEQSPSAPNRLIFRNFGGDISRGHFLNATTVIADDWQGGLRGTIENKGRTIRWANSTSWSR